MTTDTSKTATFPFKTLIWALVVVLALFLFKREVKQLLNTSEELSLFGINVKTSRGQIVKLTDSINAYKDRITNLIGAVEGQEKEISKLEKLKKKLENDVAQCPAITKNTELLNTEYHQISRNNTAIKKKAAALKSVKILSNYRALDTKTK